MKSNPTSKKLNLAETKYEKSTKNSALQSTSGCLFGFFIFLKFHVPELQVRYVPCTTSELRKLQFK